MRALDELRAAVENLGPAKEAAWVESAKSPSPGTRVRLAKILELLDLAGSKLAFEVAAVEGAARAGEGRATP